MAKRVPHNLASPISLVLMPFRIYTFSGHASFPTLLRKIGPAMWWAFIVLSAHSSFPSLGNISYPSKNIGGM